MLSATSARSARPLDADRSCEACICKLLAGRTRGVSLVVSVSVVIPCYNRADTIAQAVQSVLAQTRGFLELLVVDDASTDGSADIAERAGARVVRLARNSGEPAARNAGMHTASGDAIAWLDSDDYWEPHHLETVVPLLDRYPDAAVAASGVRFVGSRSGHWLGQIPEGPPSDVLRLAFYDWLTPSITTVVRREALMSIGGFDESERYSVDFDAWLRLARHHKFVASRELTGNWRWHDAQLSNYPEKQWEATYRFRKRTLDDVRRDGQHDLADELSALFRKRWNADVHSAWDKDQTSWLRRLVELAPLVPDLPRAATRKWSVRSRIPTPVVEVVRACKERRRPSLRRRHTLA